MRAILHFLPLLLMSIGLSAFSAATASPDPAPGHLVQVIRPGKGDARVQDTAPANPGYKRTAGHAAGSGRTRPYQPAKPGEGAPKG